MDYEAIAWQSWRVLMPPDLGWENSKTTLISITRSGFDHARNLAMMGLNPEKVIAFPAGKAHRLSVGHAGRPRNTCGLRA
jgi:hypothetical protein